MNKTKIPFLAAMSVVVAVAVAASCAWASKPQINHANTIRLAPSGGNGAMYGAGERGHKLNLRGDTLVNYNRQNYGYTGTDRRISQMNITMPLVVSADGYGIIFDDFYPSTMILGDTITYITENPSKVSYHVIQGKNTIADVVEDMTAITGRQDLPPLWTLGYITSKYGYRTQDETEGVVDTLRTLGYPVDGVVLDLYWYGREEDMGRLAWDAEQWPDPKGMLGRLADKGVNVITISQPYLLRNGRGVDNYLHLAEGGMLVKDSLEQGPQEVKIWVGEGGMFDVSNPDTRRWMADRYSQLTDMGVAGWWGDLGEPEVHPQMGRHANGLTARQYHNKYGNDWSRIIYDLFAEKYPNRRLVSMMRGGTTGLQKYSVFPWSTDVSRSWGGLQPQVRIMLNSGLSGLGYMGHDVGGFAVEKGRERDAELYVRWLQLGTFSPMLRTHAQQFAEPYLYTEYADIILPLIKSRYNWLPYNYTLAYENNTKGYPLVRPLNFYTTTQSAPQYVDVDDQYLWGRDVMIAPVLEQHATTRHIVMPPEGLWVDMRTDSVYMPSQTIADYPAPLDVLPMFARAGSFIPSVEGDMQSTKDYVQGLYTIDYYPVDGVEGSSVLFEDDMTGTKTVEKGAYRITTFTGSDRNGNINITISDKGTFEGAPEQYTYVLRVHGFDRDPRYVSVDGNTWRYTLDEPAHCLVIRLPRDAGNTVNVKIER